MSKITKGFKFRIYPNKEQQVLLARTFGSSRFIWNQCLALSIKNYEAHKANPNLPKPDIGFGVFNEYLNLLKREHEWLYDVAAVPLQQTTRHLARAFTTFFRELKKSKVAYPRFKNKSARQSVVLTRVGFTLRANEFRIVRSKDPVKIKWSRALPSYPTSVTISRDPDGKYYASFVCEADPILTNGDKETGIDLGLTDLAVLSNSDRITNPKYLVKSQKKLKYHQRQLSKKKFRSKNRNKARHKVAKLHKKISNQRNNYLHKVSRTLVNENQVLAIETLKPSNMIKNKHLAKGIADVSWNTLVKFISYKAKESHRCTIVLMNPFYPSTQLCSTCNTKSEVKLTLKVRKWTCNTCNTKHDRDVNAANNILNKAKDTLRRINPSGAWSDKLIVADLERL